MGKIQKAEEALLQCRWNEQSKRTPQDYQLWDKVQEFRDFFSDMLFECDSETRKYLECKIPDGSSEEWIADEVPLPDGLQFFFYDNFYYRVRKMKDPYMASFNRRSYSLTVDPRYLDDDFPILHEMIHMHEFVLEIYPQYYRDVVLHCLYQKLGRRMGAGKLNQRIRDHLQIANQRNYAQYVGMHDLLFLLKSFDIDLQRGYKLGTVFGYGMSEA